MSYNEAGVVVTMLAGSTALAKNTFVAVSTTRERGVVLPTTGARIMGVCLTDVATTQDAFPVKVQISGIAQVIAPESTKSYGDFVNTDSSGHIDPTAPTTNDYVVGQIVQGTSGTTGRLMSVLLITHGLPL